MVQSNFSRDDCWLIPTERGQRVLNLPTHFLPNPMPVTTSIPIRYFRQDDFGKVAYEVVGYAFEIHGLLGNRFHESVYRSTLHQILGERAVEEMRILLTHQGFEKEFAVLRSGHRTAWRGRAMPSRHPNSLAVSGRLKPASRRRFKTSHYES